MRNFTYYEFTGVLVPGATVLFSIALVYPGVMEASSLVDISIGGFGLFIVLSYALGHLVQAVGHFLEKYLWWMAWGGHPVDWLRTKPTKLLADNQLQRLLDLLPRRLGLEPFSIRDLDFRAWEAITKQIRAQVMREERSPHRVDTFNGNFSMHRGLCIGFSFIAIAEMFIDPTRWIIVALAVVAALATLWFMHIFACFYARELFVQFIELPAAEARNRTAVGDGRASGDDSAPGLRGDLNVSDSGVE